MHTLHEIGTLEEVVAWTGHVVGTNARKSASLQVVAGTIVDEIVLGLCIGTGLP